MYKPLNVIIFPCGEVLTEWEVSEKQIRKEKQKMKSSILLCEFSDSESRKVHKN